LLSLKLESADSLVALGDRVALRHSGSFYSERRDDKKNLGADGEVRSSRAESNRVQIPNCRVTPPSDGHRECA